MRIPRGSLYEFGPFRLDADDRILRCDDRHVPLTPKALETLVTLVERNGRVVSKQELLATVWPDTFVAEATLTQNIYTLRKAFAECGAEEGMIETVPRRGYRFSGPLRRVPSGGGDDGAQAGAHSLLAGSPLRDARTLAVLPLRVLGASDDAEQVGVGLADALITRLSNLRALTVRPTSAVRRYFDEERPPAQVGRELGVQVVLEGTVQTQRGRSRVTVQLVAAGDGAAVWAESFDAPSAQPFELQDSISAQVISALGLVPTRAERSRLSRRPTASREAYQDYQRGRFFWNKRTESDLRTAIRYLERAVELDPDYGHAHAGLADAYVLLPIFGNTPPGECFPEAQRAAGRALELDDGLAEAHTSLAYAKWLYDWDWNGAEEGFRRALELNPNYPNAPHWYSFFLAAGGRRDEAVRYARRAQELDPLSLVINADLGMVLYFGRRFDAAVEQQRRTLELDQDFAYGHFALALALAACGEAEEGVVAARRAVELTGGENSAMRSALGYVLAVAGRSQQARLELRHLRAREAHGHVPASRFAIIHTALGEEEAALERLEQACRQRSRFVAFLGVWPIFDDLRAGRRFSALLARIAPEPSPSFTGP